VDWALETGEGTKTNNVWEKVACIYDMFTKKFARVRETWGFLKSLCWWTLLEAYVLGTKKIFSIIYSIIISAKKIMFYPVFGWLVVCVFSLATTSRKKYCLNFHENFAKVVPWTRKMPLNFWSHPQYQNTEILQLRRRV